MRRLLTNGWLAPAAGKLNEVLQRTIARNDAAQTRANAIKTVENQVSMLQKQIEGGTCPTCHQELPPPDEATRQALAKAQSDLQRMRNEGGRQCGHPSRAANPRADRHQHCCRLPGQAETTGQAFGLAV